MSETSETSDFYSILSKGDLNFDICEEKTQIRCPICSDLVNIVEANFKKNFFSISCKQEHENDFINYNSFSSFIENVSKNMDNILCKKCKRSKYETEFFRCNDCYLFFCKECIIKHEKEISHSKYININDIDKKCEDTLNFNSRKPGKNEIIKEYNNIKENINICEEITNLFNDWIDDLTKKFNGYILLLNNYFCLEKLIVSNIKTYYNSGQMILNNNIFENYEILHPNKYFINNYVQSLNKKIKLSGNSLSEKSLLFFKIIQNFEEIDDYFILSQKPLDLVVKSKSEKLNCSNEFNIEEKISEMKIIKFDCEQIQSFNSFRDGKFLFTGTKDGNLSIYDISQNEVSKKEKFDLIIQFKIFEEVKFICIINKYLVLISDGKNNIKILKIEEDISKYNIIQTIVLKYNILHNILPLEIISQGIISYNFCISDNNNIAIFNESNTDETNFSELKTISLNTIAKSLIEVNNKYLIVSCPKKSKIIFYDIKNDFKEVGDIKGISSSFNNDIFALINDNTILIIGTIDGFQLISIKTFSKIKSIHCKYSIKSLILINKDIIIFCNEDKNKNNKIRQFQINEKNHNFKKISERIIDSNDEICKLQLIRGKIYFLKKNGELFFLK